VRRVTHERCDLCLTALDFDHEVRIKDEVYCSQGCAIAHGHNETPPCSERQGEEQSK
jgi:hypothetical protein